ncbi:MAG TPA: glycosyltransferase, partial [Paracoccaceae bacterium]|nr:glycosyltransferase [Paracoccaceae bacterium]
LFRVCSPASFHDLGTYLIGRKEADEPVPFHITIPIRSMQSPGGGEGRIFFDIVSEGECELSELCFASDRPPAREVSVSLGICTYRKEELLVPNLENLERHLASGRGRHVDRVFVVNNDSAALRHPVIRSLAVRCPRIEILDQRNLGGAGGFTRSLIESLERSPATHHVMLDDDVFFDPEVIDKVVLFLMYVGYDIAVGGQMMNMKAPQVLYEGGAKLSRTGLLERVGVNIDCGRADTIGFFDQYREVDYNAWWFCAIPKRAVRAAGLPLNIFIRGDDFEYAIRLGEHGVPTVSLPGVYVWHEPFEQKTAAWLEYYNMRNRLIFCAAHAGASGYEQLDRRFYQDFCDGSVAEGDYEKLAATLLAVADFLAGPDPHFSRDAEENHAALRELLGLVRSERGLLATGPGYDTVSAAMRSRIAGFDRYLAAAGEATPWDHSGPIEETGRAGVRQLWEVLANAVLSALEEEVGAATLLWGERTPSYASFEYWAQVFGRRPDELAAE